VFCLFSEYADRQGKSFNFRAARREFGSDKVQLGIIRSAFNVGYAFGAPLAGFVGDRVRRKS
jgi:sugar phosphate permease